MAESALERDFYLMLKYAGLPEPEREYRFHDTRRWRFDFCWPAHMLAVEIDGATWANGRHSRGAGIEADCEKYSEAAILGWRIIRLTAKMVKTGVGINYVNRAMK